MVCQRCKLVIKSLFESLSFNIVSLELGEVEISSDVTEAEKNNINKALQELGFELMDDKKSRLIERIKNIIIELVHHNPEQLKTNLSDYLSSKLFQDYNYLSNLFSEIEGITIEKYFIAQKIEKVKELLVYDELSLSEISYRLHYSSVAYLSSQFKRVTGLTPSHFKLLSGVKRMSLDKV